MSPNFPEVSAAICFFAALAHSLNAKGISRIADRQNSGSIHGRILHLLSESETIFVFYACLYLLAFFISRGSSEFYLWIGRKDLSGAFFMMLILIAAATGPILELASTVIKNFARVLPLRDTPALYASVLFLGPLLGSLITEPAAMVVSALLLQRLIFTCRPSVKLFYSTLAALFINVSVGGVLTAFAAPPVLMVASTWQWDSLFVFSHLGWKAVLAVLFNTGLVLAINFRELNIDSTPKKDLVFSSTFSISGVGKAGRFFVLLGNIAFLIFFIRFAESAKVLFSLSLLFALYLGFTRKNQGPLSLKIPIQVGLFLGALMILTSDQTWWLKPAILKLRELPLYVLTVFATGITDNAALTSLAAQVPGLPEQSKYAVLAGAVAGGGLTLIANAPNPAGLALLKTNLGVEPFSPGLLLRYALPLTFITGVTLWIL